MKFVRSFLKNICSSPIVTDLAYKIIQLYHFTIRVEVQNEKSWLDLKKNGERILFCSFHQQIFAGVYHFSKYTKTFPGHVLISQSKDGQIVADIALKTGWKAIRGSSSKGGVRALKEVVKCLKKGDLVTVFVDGPRGPIGKVKPGLIAMAIMGKAHIVPFYVRPSRYFALKSWDQFFFPYPFSKIKICFDTPLYFANKTNIKKESSEQGIKSSLPEYCSLLEKKMNPHLITKERKEEKTNFF